MESLFSFFLSGSAFPHSIPKQIVRHCIHSMPRIRPLPLLLPLILVQITCLSPLGCGQSLLSTVCTSNLSVPAAELILSKVDQHQISSSLERPQWFSLNPVGKSNFYRGSPDLLIFHSPSSTLQEVLLVDSVRSLLKYHFAIEAFPDQVIYMESHPSHWDPLLLLSFSLAR